MTGARLVGISLTIREVYSILRRMNSNSELIKTWGRQQLAKDLCVPKERVRGWERYNLLPAPYWKDILTLAPLRDINLSADVLVTLAARPSPHA